MGCSSRIEDLVGNNRAREIRSAGLRIGDKARTALHSADEEVSRLVRAGELHHADTVRARACNRNVTMPLLRLVGIWTIIGLTTCSP
jgi:hypothetical protein